MQDRKPNKRKNYTSYKTVNKCRPNLYIRCIFFSCIFFIFFTFFNCLAEEKTKTEAPPLLAPFPNYYNSPSEIWDIEIENYKKTLLKEWYVFAYKENVKIFKNIKDKDPAFSASFLERFTVSEKKERHLFVKSNLNSNKKGWANIKEFIILPHAIRTENSVYYKALPINRFKIIDDNINSIAPRISPDNKSPTCGTDIKILELAYIYAFHPYPENLKTEKEINKIEYYLLGKKPVFYPHIKYNDSPVGNVILGWVPKNRILMWNTREALQPVEESIKKKERKVRETPIYYFPTKESLIKKDIKTLKFEIKPEKFYKKWPKHAFRYPILDYNENDKYCHIAMPNTAIPNNHIPQVIQVIEWNTPEGMDVVFLIDGTKSMEGYISTSRDIAKKIMTDVEDINSNVYAKNLSGNSTIRFAIAVYRDYKDKEEKFKIISYLTKNRTKLNIELNNVKTITNREKLKDPGAYPEALFLGIKKTISRMNWETNARKLIIVIGDAGNHDNNGKDFTPKSIAMDLWKYDISLAAIQIIEDTQITAKKKAQKKFCSDIHKTISETISIYSQKLEELKKIIPENIFDYAQYKSYYDQLQNRIEKANCENNCSTVDNSRWNLTCIRFNTLPQEKQKHLSTKINQQIENLCIQLSEAVTMVDTIRLGSPDISSDIDKNYRAELMPGIVNSLIEQIGNRVFLEESAQKNSLSSSDTQIIYQLGAKKLKKYLSEGAMFYKEAYVSYSPPPYEPGVEPQFVKMILLSRKDIENLQQVFYSFNVRHNQQLTRKVLIDIWRTFIKSILGEPDIDVIFELLKRGSNIDDYSVKKTLEKSPRELILQHHGIKIKKEHKILNMTFKEIYHIENYLDSEELEELTNFLKDTYKYLKKIIDDEKIKFKMFHYDYYWVKASDLP